MWLEVPPATSIRENDCAHFPRYLTRFSLHLCAWMDQDQYPSWPHRDGNGGRRTGVIRSRLHSWCHVAPSVAKGIAMPTVMVVDDAPLTRSTLKRLLVREGYDA